MGGEGLTSSDRFSHVVTKDVQVHLAFIRGTSPSPSSLKSKT